VYPRPIEEAGRWAGLTQVSWDAAQWNTITRRLANQSHGYFMSMHEVARSGAGLQGSEVLLYSRYFRSALHECVLALRAEERRTSSEVYRQQEKLFSTMALVWHLTEILFIEVLPAGCLVHQLAEWVCWAGKEGERECLQGILGHTPPDRHGDYWRMLYHLVLTGRLTEARNLLAHHSAAGSMERVFSSMDELLCKAPMVRSSSSLTRAEQQHSWQQWRRECCSRRDAGDFVALPQLQLLARVLCGDEDIFNHPEVVASCGSWYELMVGRLLFTTPLVISTDYDLVYSAEASIKACGHSSGPLDTLLLAALRQNALEVVSLASSELSNWWLAAHLADLLQQRDALHTQPEYGSKLSEFLLVEYASSLLAHQSLWQLAMDYFSECPSLGRHHMALHIERVPLSSARKATKVLQLCHRFQLKEQAQCVCRVMSMREFRSGRLGAALSWCLQAKDAVFAAFLAEKYFVSYQSLGEFMDLDLLDHLGAAMLLSEKLTFLGKYREFHRLYEEQQFHAAGQLLVSLLQSGIVPKRFWLTLLMDALPLLTLSEQPVFSAEDTTTLAHCLQQLTSQPRINQSHSATSHDTGKTSPDPLAPHSSKISLLRLALCKNLARATLEEFEQSL
jgi:nuclear pore complex protein Nup85